MYIYTNMFDLHASVTYIRVASFVTRRKNYQASKPVKFDCTETTNPTQIQKVH